MANNKTTHIHFSEATGALPENLQIAQKQLSAHINSREPLQTAWNDLQTALSQIAQQADWQTALQQAQTGAQHHLLRLSADNADNAWLKLPFAMLAERYPHLYILKSLAGNYREQEFIPNNPLPLKILVMISSPDDTEVNKRISHEDEEHLLLQAFESLMRDGKVEIDYTDDGSLEALDRKLAENHYHILHFSGHGTVDAETGEGYLELEHPLTLRSEKTPARDFANTLRNKPEHMPALVMLSACKTTQGGKQADGMVQAVLNVGVPAVIGMSHSIDDRYAAYFASYFYAKIANQMPVYQSFKEALDLLKRKEYEDNKANNNIKTVTQWLIPQLFVSQPITHLVDWTSATKHLQLDSYLFLLHREENKNEAKKTYGKKLKIGKKTISPVFIGRRKERAKILKPFIEEKKAILLRGQGGVGKTNMAAYLIKRLIAKFPNTQPFIFTEKDGNIQSVFDQLEDFFEGVDDEKALEIIDNKEGKAKRRLRRLFKRLPNYCTPVFLFDNIETFQVEKGGDFAVQHSDLVECIQILCAQANIHLILTGRYGTTQFEGLQTFDLNQVSFVDFWKKCTYLPNLQQLRLAMDKQQTYWRKNAAAQHAPTKHALPQTFVEVIRLLYQNFGGNYRYVELLDTLIGQQAIAQTQALVQQLYENLEVYQAKVREKAGADLVFSQLLAALQAEDMETLQYLAKFGIAVLPLALHAQMGQPPKQAVLDKLQRLTLLEKTHNYDLEAATYYVTPLLKDLLHHQKDLPHIHFDVMKAANYHYIVFKNQHPNLADLDEAFEYFCVATPINVVALNDVANMLSHFYYNSSLFKNAFYYAQQAVQILKEETEPSILNILGQTLYLFGENEGALFYFQQAQKKCQEVEDTEGEGIALNNIARIYRDESNYVTALSYLQKSLAISQQIGSKSGEGTTLNNISQIYDAQGDSVTALSYLERSLAISQQIGNKSGEGATLNNIAGICRDEGNYGRALSYLQKSLAISQQIGDKSGEGTILNNISQIYDAQGDFVTALSYLNQSLAIRKQIGDKSGEGVTLFNMGTLAHAQGDYVRGLNYLRQSLAIRKQIGDKLGEGTTLNNISQIYDSQGDYSTALSYLNLSLAISQQIGDKSGMCTTLHNMAMIAREQEDFEQYMEYEVQAYQLATEINEAQGIVVIGKALGSFLCHVGQKEYGLPMLQKSYALASRAGMPQAASIKEWIEHFS